MLFRSEATEKVSQAVVKVTGELKIVLPDLKAPDHYWRVIGDDPRILRPIGEPKQAAPGGNWEITLKAGRAGRSLVRFIWAKVGDADTVTYDGFRRCACASSRCSKRARRSGYFFSAAGAGAAGGIEQLAAGPGHFPYALG